MAWLSEEAGEEAAGLVEEEGGGVPEEDVEE